jgi:dipeptidyl aminopeptidase/acylaminoacyl peptidase
MLRLCRLSMALLSALLVCFSAACLPATTEKAVPLAVEDALDVRRFGELSAPVFSPQGTWVAYMVQENRRMRLRDEDLPHSYAHTGVSEYEEQGDLWITNTKSGETKNLTGGVGSNWGATWSPDGSLLAFVSDRDGSGQAKVWIWTLRLDTLRMVSSLPVRMPSGSHMSWTPDSKKILVTVVPEGLTLDRYLQEVFATEPSPSRRTEGSEGPTVQVYRATGDGQSSASPVMNNLDAEFRHDLVSVDIATGNAAYLLRGRRIGWFSLSGDGARVACTVVKRFAKPASWQLTYDIVVVELKTMHERTLGKDLQLVSRFSWSPDSGALGFAAFGENGSDWDLYVAYVDRETVIPIAGPRGGAHSRIWSKPPIWDRSGTHIYFVLEGVLWRASIREHTSEPFARIANRSINSAFFQPDEFLWSPDGEKSTIVLTHDGESKSDGFYSVDLADGKTTPLFESGQSFLQWPFFTTVPYRTAISYDGRQVVYVAEDVGHAPDLWYSDAGFQHPRQLTHLNPQFEKYKMGSGRLVKWLSDDGEPLEGAVLLPPDYQEGKHYPLVVWVNPKLLSNELHAFGFGEFPSPWNMQLFATRGYVVLFPDIPAAQPIARLVKSVLPGVNKVVEMGIADPERIGVMGHSQGASATVELIVQTPRFKAAMAASGSYDWTSDFGTMRADGTGYQYIRGRLDFGADPWQQPLRYVQNSALYSLDQVRTPVLIVQGTYDTQTARSQADELFVDLRVSGKEAEYASYEREGHAPSTWSYSNQVDLANRTIAFLAKHLL